MELSNNNKALDNKTFAIKSPGFNLGDGKTLPPEFYFKNTPQVARQLLGKIIITKSRNETVAVLITETEAYLSVEDLASHSASGMTLRNKMMFEEGGTCYVYLSYGMHYCFNVVTRAKGIGEAVLIRAGIAEHGANIIAKRRNKDVNARDLLNGPGKIAQGLGMDLTWNAKKFWDDDLKIIEGQKVSSKNIEVTSRIGISKSADLPLRFLIKKSSFC